MRQKLVRYKVKPEALTEHRRLVEAVFEALRARAPEDVSYMVIELGDGSFFHLKTDLAEDAFDITELPAFQAFTREIGDRCDEPPRAADARLVGSYRTAFGG